MNCCSCSTASPSSLSLGALKGRLACGRVAGKTQWMFENGKTLGKPIGKPWKMEVDPLVN